MHDLAENYRSIPILPTMSKLLERTVHYQLYSFLEENRLLSLDTENVGQQSWLLFYYVIPSVKVLKVFESHLVGLFLDLSKAFDTIYGT